MGGWDGALPEEAELRAEVGEKGVVYEGGFL